MARGYLIRKGDTLRKVAKRFYGDQTLYNDLALYNGILDPDWIIAGQRLEVPSKRDLLKPDGSGSSGEMTPPHGLEQILLAFGNIYDFIGEDGRLRVGWEQENLRQAHLPFPIPLSWDLSRAVRTLYCHRALSDRFSEVFATIEARGLREEIRTYGGCFNFRSKRTSGKLSTHSWGIAIDLNPRTNRPGSVGDVDLAIVEIFRSFGFKWGGDWSYRSKDPMHFQFCTGY